MRLGCPPPDPLPTQRGRRAGADESPPRRRPARPGLTPMSRTPDPTGSADPLPTHEALLAQANQANSERDHQKERLLAATEWARPYGRDITDFCEALHRMLELEGNALHPPPDDFDGQPWVPHLLTAGRLIGERGWEDMVRGFAVAQPYTPTQAFVRLLLEIADGRCGEAEVRQRVADLHRVGLVRAMTWQYASTSLSSATAARFNADVSSRLAPPVPPAAVHAPRTGDGAMSSADPSEESVTCTHEGGGGTSPALAKLIPTATSTDPPAEKPAVVPPTWNELNNTKRLILSALFRAQNPLSGQKLAKQAPCAHSTLRKHVPKLVTWGYAVRLPTGYSITGAGKSLIPRPK